MVVNQLKDDNFLLKCATPDQAKCPQFSFGSIQIPLYCFASQSLDDSGPFGRFSCIPDDEPSTLESLLLAQWEDRMWKGIYRYDVTTSEIKIIGGRRKFLAQLNEEWNMDHLSDPDENEVCWRGDSFIFNWVKHHEELLFCVASGEKAIPELIPTAPVPNASILVLSNVTPVEYGHVFLVPHGFTSISQFMDARSLEMVTRVAMEVNNRSFRVFYDCSMPSASLYFQACYFSNPLPVEVMPVVTLWDNGLGGTRICSLIDYPIKALLLESKSNVKVSVEVLAEICSCLQGKNIPYSFLISDCGKRIFLFPQMRASANSHALSSWECSGHFVFKSRNDFDQVTEEAMLERMGTASLDEPGFQVVKQLCCNIASKLAS